MPSAEHGLVQGDSTAASHENVMDAVACSVLSSAAHRSLQAARDALIEPCLAPCKRQLSKQAIGTSAARYQEALQSGEVPPFEGCLIYVQRFRPPQAPQTTPLAASSVFQDGGQECEAGEASANSSNALKGSDATANVCAARGEVAVARQVDDDALAAELQQCVVLPSSSHDDVAKGSKRSKKGGKKRAGKARGRINTSQLD